MSWKNFARKLYAQKVFVVGIPVPLSYVLLFILGIITLNSIRAWANRDKWSTLTHNQYGFSIDHPANWLYETFGDRGSKNLHELKASINTRPLGPLGPNKALWIHWVPMENPTLEKAVDWGVEKFSRYEGTVSDLEEATIGAENYPAWKRSFQYAHSSAKRIHYYVVNERGAFILEFYLRDEKLEADTKPVFDRMLASFQMFEPATAAEDGLEK